MNELLTDTNSKIQFTATESANSCKKQTYLDDEIRLLEGDCLELM